MNPPCGSMFSSDCIAKDVNCKGFERGHSMSFELSRRKMLSDSLVIGVAGAAYLPLLAEPLPQNAKTAKEKEKEPEVTATEDLMREHGVIRRALLVYYEVIPKL